MVQEISICRLEASNQALREELLTVKAALHLYAAKDNCKDKDLDAILVSLVTFIFVLFVSYGAYVIMFMLDSVWEQGTSITILEVELIFAVQFN